MPSLHLPLHRLGYVLRGELAVLLGQNQLPGEVKQEVAQLVANESGVAFTERVVELQHLLHEVRAERLPGLLSVPRAAHAQIAHHDERSSKRRLVLHLALVTD